MISRQTKLQLLVFLLISAVGLSYTAVRYAGLGRFFIDEGYVVSAVFEDSGGIFKGAEVTYRGVTSGSVVDLDLVEEGVRVDLQLRPDVRVPDDLDAVVRNRSAVGEQYVDLQPQREGAPFLEEGGVIPKTRTDIPLQPSELVVNLDDFVTSIDTRELGIVLDELGQAFDDGAGNSLQRLVDSGNELTEAAAEALPETKALIRDGNIALETQRDVAGQFRSYNADLADLAATLRSSDPDFRRLFANGTASAQETTELISANRSALPVLLDGLITFAQVQKVRLPALRQILVTYPNVVAGGFTVVPGDGTSHFGLVEDGNPPICDTGGYRDTQERPPSDTTLRTPNLGAYCFQEEGSSTSVRGARNAPYAPGAKPFPENRGGTAAPSRTPSVGPDEPAEDQLVLGDHDPVTGRVITEDGQRYTIGSTSRASRVFGEDSWQWLVLGPLSQ